MKHTTLRMLVLGVLALAFSVSYAFEPAGTMSYLHSLGSADLGMAGASFMMMGDTQLLEVKSLIEKQGRDWEEFKKTNDERIAKMAKGESVTDLEVKLSKMNDALNEANAELKQIALKASRPAMSAESEEKAARYLKSFNGKAQAQAIELGTGFNALSADGYKQYQEAMGIYIRKGKESLTAEQMKAINVGTAGQGGFLTGEEMEVGIDRVIGNYGAMRQIATVKSIGQASYKKLVKTSGTTGGTRGNERTAPSEGNSPNWSELEFKTGTYLSDQRISSESLEDSVQDVEGDLTEEIGMEFAEMEGADFIEGDGINGPRGLLAYPTVANNNWGWGKVGFVTSGGAAGFAATDPSDKLIDVQHALKRQFRANAVWTMNDATLAEIRKFKDGNGIYLWAPSGLLQGVAGQLLGHAVVTDDFMPDLGSNAFPIAFGDFKRAYYVIDRKGIAILRDPYTAVPYVKFVARKRVGGGIANFQAVKLLKCAA